MAAMLPGGKKAEPGGSRKRNFSAGRWRKTAGRLAAILRRGLGSVGGGFLDLLALLAELDMIENVAPVQLAIRLLIPQGSRILELTEMEAYLGGFDAEKLSYRWTPADPRADDLQAKVCEVVRQGEREGVGRRAIFQRVWKLAHAACERVPSALPPACADGRPVPAMSEPWYCCAEPTEEQLLRV